VKTVTNVPSPTPAEEPSDDGAGAGQRSLDRPFKILEVLRESRVPMRLTDIAGASHLHLATTQRLVNLLIRHGYVEREGQLYRIGLTSMINGFTYLLTNGLIQCAEPVLLELTASTKLTSMLNVRHDLTQVRVFRVLGTPPPRYQAEVGEQISLVSGGARIFAAWLSDEDLERLLEGVDTIALASGKVLDRREFVDSLAAIRDRGYAFGQGQGESGSVSIAVPVFAHQGEIVASVQVTGLIEEIPFDVDALVFELKRASTAITRRMP